MEYIRVAIASNIIIYLRVYSVFWWSCYQLTRHVDETKLHRFSLLLCQRTARHYHESHTRSCVTLFRHVGYSIRRGVKLQGQNHQGGTFSYVLFVRSSRSTHVRPCSNPSEAWKQLLRPRNQHLPTAAKPYTPQITCQTWKWRTQFKTRRIFAKIYFILTNLF